MSVTAGFVVLFLRTPTQHNPTSVSFCIHPPVCVCARAYTCGTTPPRWQGASIMINRETRRLSHAITLHYGSQDFKVKMNDSSSTWRLHISSFFFFLALFCLLFLGRDLYLFSQPPFVVRLIVFVHGWTHKLKINNKKIHSAHSVCKRI